MFIFSHGESGYRTMITERVSSRYGINMTDEMRPDLSHYLASWRNGSLNWICFHERPESGCSAIATEFEIDIRKPWFGLLTSVMSDAQLH